jgi:hypothetical protein
MGLVLDIPGWLLTSTHIICCRLISRFPWQPVTNANKCLPLLGGMKSVCFILEVYLLTSAALYYWVPLTTTAAEDGCATLKKPLLAGDGSAAITDDAAAGDVAAKRSPAAAEAGVAEP